ncbi:hypothetical protein [Boudabousia marimammalium]|uniref:hypothetical protein n=1 Tax=Boudabousia marimammalium TaxID=156892 RepID=UPI000AE2DA1A|nr:hypothetical protein [Boudabousia marimammalium]
MKDFIQIRIRETVAGLAAASLVTLVLAPIAALAPASYAAPQVLPFNEDAHILPFDGIEDPATAGTVTINGGDVLLPGRSGANPLARVLARISLVFYVTEPNTLVRQTIQQLSNLF